MSDLAVNVDSMNVMTRNYVSALEELKSSLNLMHESVMELNKTWEGPNHTAFVEKFEAEYEKMEQLNQMLDTYLASVKKAKKAYVVCESDVEELVGQLR